MVNGFQTFLYENPGCGDNPGPYATPLLPPLPEDIAVDVEAPI